MRTNRILFVDDDTSLRRVVARGLTQAGLGVDIANGPDAAMRSARTGSYAVIASDLNMPGGSGADLLRALRPIQPQAKMILVSGSACEVGDYEVDYFIQKPWAFAELLGVLDEAIADHRDG